MNDEIKEIIELINTKYKDYYIDDFLSGEDIKKLIDYITNLQEENERLKENIEVIDKSACFWEDTSDNYETRMNNYLSRNEKAIEYITSEETINMFSSINAREKWLKINYKLLNILQGSDK